MSSFPRIAAIAAGHVPSGWAHSINFVRQAWAFTETGAEVCLYSILREREDAVKGEKSLAQWYGIGEMEVKYTRERGWQYYMERPWIQRVFYGIQKLTRHRLFPLSPGAVSMAHRVVEDEVDLAHCRSFDVVPTLVKAGVPTIFETHGLNIHPGRPVFRQIISVAQQKALKGLVVPSQPVADAWIRMGFPSEKAFVLPNGVDLSRYEPDLLAGKRVEIRQQLGWAEGDFVAAYTGHLYKGRGIEEILAAARLEKHINFLIVGGRPEDVARYEAQATGLPNVIFTGMVPNGEVPWYTEAADALLMPYTRDTPTWREMSPVKMYEYLAAGRPIVTTSLPNLKEMLEAEQEALFVPEKDGKALADALARLRDDAALRTAISENNRQRAKRHSLVARAEAILRIGLD